MKIKAIKCEYCNGTGSIGISIPTNNNEFIEEFGICPKCKGTKIIIKEELEGVINMNDKKEKCSICDGKGEFYNDIKDDNGKVIRQVPIICPKCLLEK